MTGFGLGLHAPSHVPMRWRSGGPTTWRTTPHLHVTGLRAAGALDVAAKGALVVMLVLVLLNPDYGNLEGKAPVARAVTYPLLAFVLPAVWLVRRPARPFPWVADLLLTLVCFSDILGNRLDLYDSVVWFDDWMHFMDTGLVAAAIVLLTVGRGAGLDVLLPRAVAVGVTAALAWEVFELVSFMTRSPELPDAYADTLGDLVLGWWGAVVAALVIAAVRRGSGEPQAR